MVQQGVAVEGRHCGLVGDPGQDALGRVGRGAAGVDPALEGDDQDGVAAAGVLVELEQGTAHGSMSRVVAAAAARLAT